MREWGKFTDLHIIIKNYPELSRKYYASDSQYQVNEKRLIRWKQRIDANKKTKIKIGK